MEAHQPQVVYVVDFDTDELVRKSIDALNLHLNVSKLLFKVETGEMDEIKSKEELQEGGAFGKSRSKLMIRSTAYMQTAV